MNHSRLILFAIFVAAQVALFGFVHAADPGRTLNVAASRGERVAVVIGNSRYPSGALANPRNDATAVATSLKKLGFDVDLKLDATRSDMDAIFKRFSARAEKAGVAALFYAGHGIQVGGANYIVPIDAKPQTERDLKREMIKMDDIIDDMGAAKVKLVFFDACRDNPLARSFSRGGTRGMAAPVEATGTLISFATKHGNTASDGDGRHSPYTTALLAALEDPAGIEIEQMLRRVQQGVKLATNGQQEPWRYGSLDGDFYFISPAPRAEAVPIRQEAVDRVVQEAVRRASDQAAAEAMRRAGEQQVASAAAIELSFWESIKASNSVDDFREYLASYPQGRFAGLARNRLRVLGSAPAPAAVAATAPTKSPGTPPAMQVAMIPVTKPALEASTSPATPPSLFPRPGDTWVYRYVDIWKKDAAQTVTVRVDEADAERVTDRMFVRGGRADERTFEKNSEPAERPLGRDVRVLELMPYPQALLETMKPGEDRVLPETSLGGRPYRIAARVVGKERITLAAGTFDAMRIEFAGRHLGLAPIQGGGLIPATFAHTVWYAREVGRVIKALHKSSNAFRPTLEEESLELVSFSVSAQAEVASPARVVETPTSKPEVAELAVWPKPGDTWTYRYSDGWKKNSEKTVAVKVEAFEDGRVSDKMSLRGGKGVDERTYEGKPEGVERSLGEVRVVELLPYVQSLIAEGLAPGQIRGFPEITLNGHAYRITATVVGREAVRVPAGTFNAMLLRIDGQRVVPPVPDRNGLGTQIGQFSHTLWFSPEIRRAVKIEHKAGNRERPRLDDDTMELISYSLK